MLRSEGVQAISNYDVMIVGSGPAGSTAAYFLGKAGKRVLVLEKERLPRYKTCGGGLSLRFLRQQFPFSFEPLTFERASTISYIFKGQQISVPLSSEAIGMVMRADFDAYLLSHARAEVIQESMVQQVREYEDHVTVETRDGLQFDAAYLIGADGANSRVARTLGLRSKRALAAAIEAEVQVSPTVMQRFEHQMTFIFGEIRLGYLWIFAKPQHLSVGIAAWHPKPGALQETLKKVMARYAISLDGVPLHGHPIPIYQRREPIATSRTLLVGDAAGLADPLSGEGIRFAIKSGRLAAESILRGEPEQYTRRLQREIGWNHLLTKWIAVSFYFLQNLYLFVGTPNPFSTHGIIEMLADQMNAATFILYGLATLPVFILTEITAWVLNRLGKTALAKRLRNTVYPEWVGRAYRIK